MTLTGVLNCWDRAGSEIWVFRAQKLSPRAAWLLCFNFSTLSPPCLRAAPCSLTRRAGLPEFKNPFSPPQKGPSSNGGSCFAWRAALCSRSSCYLHAVVVCAFPVQVAAVIVHAAVIQGAEAHEAVLEGIITFLVHVVMPNHILFTSESLERYRDRQWDTWWEWVGGRGSCCC